MEESKKKENKLQHLRDNFISHDTRQRSALDSLVWKQSKLYRNLSRIMALSGIIFAVTSTVGDLKNLYVAYGSLILVFVLLIVLFLMRKKILKQVPENILRKELTRMQHRNENFNK